MWVSTLDTRLCLDGTEDASLVDMVSEEKMLCCAVMVVDVEPHDMVSQSASLYSPAPGSVAKEALFWCANPVIRPGEWDQDSLYSTCPGLLLS